jgi:hypothetical protein
MEQWTVEHRMFAYAYVENGECSAVQRLFLVHFNLGSRDTVRSRNTILRWIQSDDNMKYCKEEATWSQ